MQTLAQRGPRHITRGESENQVFIPCPYISRELAPSIWRINETEYTSATLPSIFSLDSDGLFINMVHRCLDQTSFQCIDTSERGLQWRESSIGTLSVTPTSGGCTSEHCYVLYPLHTPIRARADLDIKFYVCSMAVSRRTACNFIEVGV